MLSVPSGSDDLLARGVSWQHNRQEQECKGETGKSGANARHRSSRMFRVSERLHAQLAAREYSEVRGCGTWKRRGRRCREAGVDRSLITLRCSVRRRRETAVAMEKPTLSLKLLVDTVNQRVLFAEAGKDVVDFLFSLLALPLGTVTRLLASKGMVGSVGKLYGGLEVLDGTYVKAGFNKDVLLKPKVPAGTFGQSAFLLDGEHLQLPANKQKYYRCNDDRYSAGGYGRTCSSWSSYVTDALGTPCPSCSRPMRNELTYLSHKPQTDQVNAAGKGYVEEIVIYTVMDDLTVQPMSAISSIALLNKFRVLDVSSLEERTVQLGLEEASHLNQSPLLNLTLKLLVDKEKKKVLFAEAGKDVADFLFSLLALPLGTVTRLLAEKEMVGSVGKLYGSLERLDGTYLKAGVDRNTLLKPTIQSNTPCQTTFLLESSQSTAVKSFYRCDGGHYCNYVTDGTGARCPNCNRPMTDKITYVAPPKQKGTAADAGREGYVQGVVTYVVMDDLAVEPMSTISCITVLNRFQIKDLSSLEERTVELGFEEGLLMLKASLLSKTILSDVFLRTTISILEKKEDPLF
ncbi:hypothetical protein Taro_042157 [Colocasia esculenta]|uniref:DUF674 domain-containing protein n=1 Tax=Colocasia esculenta TaxID=4460 RepID=A0A843WHP3_COLES|nr:hypothetical protein [Colocasia esculenta]